MIPTELLTNYLYRYRTFGRLFFVVGIDHSSAFKHVVFYFADKRRRYAEQGQSYPFFTSNFEHWSRRQETSGESLSIESKELLWSIWSDTNQEKYARKTALNLWGITFIEGDIERLYRFIDDSNLHKDIVSELVKRRDLQAIDYLMTLINEDRHWWQYGKYVWSNEMASLLDQHIEEDSLGMQNFLLCVDFLSVVGESEIRC